MKAFFSQKKKAILARTIVLGLCLMTPWSRAEAVTSHTTPNGLIRLDYYGAGESFTSGENIWTSDGTLPDWQKERINLAADYWDGLLKHTSTARQPAVLAVVSDDTYNNASGHGYPAAVMVEGKPVIVTGPNAVLNHGMTLTENAEPAARIKIGAVMFPTDASPHHYDTPLPQDSTACLTPNMIHEIGHAMGLDAVINYSVPAFYEYPFLYDSHLYDWRGVQARPGMEIQTVNHRASAAEYFDLPGYFMEDDTTRLPYFSGEHVQDVLQGAQLCNYDPVGYKRNQSVPGIPINGNETFPGDGDSIELSHIELRNGLLSHQKWRNYVSPMEAELALFQDLGYTIDRRDFFGRSVYGDGLTIVNDAPYYARNADGTAYVNGAYNKNPYGMGLHIYGSENTVFQNAPLMTKGMGAVGIRVDGYGNNVTVNNGVNVQADGVNGNGILIAYGKDHNITLAQGSRVTAAGEGGIGAAFDFGQNYLGNNEAARASYAVRYWIYRLDADLMDIDGPLVTDFTVQGELAGQKAAIEISDNAYVKNIHIGTGAKLSGDIISRWVYDDEKITRVVDGKVVQDTAMWRMYYGGGEMTTRLAFEGTGLTYDGNITGTENMRLFVSGDLVYGGTAQVLSATVEKGGSLFGGTHNLIPDDAVRNEPPAMGYSFPYIFGRKKELQNVGLFTNHGTIGAASKDTTMKITGDLVSDGTLQAYAGGTGGYIDVSGRADINGSDVKIANWSDALPGESITVVKAASIIGDTKTPVGTSYAVSGMMSAQNEIKDNVLSVVTKAENNLGAMDASQSETFGAMVAIDNSLKANGDPRREEMQPLFSLSPAAAKEALSAISSNASAQSMAVAQRSMMTHHILSSRLNEAFMPKPVKVKLPEASLNDTAADGLDVSLKLLEPAENDIWLKFGKNWGDLKDGADYHSSTTLLGYDKAVAPNWRVGAFAGYSSTGFSDNTANNELKDTRFGLYAGYNKAGREAMAYLDFGWMRNKLRRGIPGMGLTANARYHSRILELGGEYLYDLHAAKNTPWHVRPYVNAQLSRLWQNGYSEEGAGVFNQVVQGKHNDYFGMGAGIEFKRYLKGGNYAVRAGVRHAFAGAEPKLRYSYMGDAANTYDMRNVQDKTHFVLSIGGEAEVAKGWSIGGDAGFTRGRHDKDFSCSVTVKRMW
ncbi:MAG: autotransporter domain-containing protein [Acidaminococcaceae bacterium]|nr:autotransporter domain-containing protein [Acidaminococcaceae bacterium]